MNREEQIRQMESELCEFIYRWQQESDLDVMDTVMVLECTKMNLYIEYKNQEIELE